MKKKAAKITQKTEIPAYLEEGSQFAVKRATEIADRPYQAYEDRRVAGLSAGERQAMNLAATESGAGGEARGYLTRAGEELGRMEEFTPENLAKYQDPYVEQVVKGALRKEAEAYGTRQANLGAKASAMGAFGGSRQALLESAETGRHLEATGDIAARGYQEAFRNAAALWQTDNQRRLATAEAYRGVGGDVTRMTSQQISDLVRTGQTSRLLEQADLDVNYLDFIEKRDWDVNNLQPLLATLSSVPHSTTTTKTQQKGSAGPWGTILGVAGTAIGAYYGGFQGAQAGGAIGGGIGGMVDEDQPYSEG